MMATNKFGLLLMLSLITLRAAFKIVNNYNTIKRGIRRVNNGNALKSQDGHQVASTVTITPEEQLIIDKLKEHQSKAPKLTFAEEVRTLIDQSLHFGVISTNSVTNDGYPFGSVVGFNLDSKGLPFFSFSTMSGHTTDLLKDSKCSLTILAKNFQGAAEGRVTIAGNVRKVFDEKRIEELKSKYLEFHKDAYWINFGDFSFFQMESIETIRFVGGFAMAGTITAEEYLQAKPDPLAAYSDAVLKHMNEDHSDSVISMIKHYTGVPCSEAQIRSLDRLGMTVKAKIDIGNYGYAKIRLPFPYEVTERKKVKEVLVEMTKASNADTT